MRKFQEDISMNLSMLHIMMTHKRKTIAVLKIKVYTIAVLKVLCFLGTIKVAQKTL